MKSMTKRGMSGFAMLAIAVFALLLGTTKQAHAQATASVDPSTGGYFSCHFNSVSPIGFSQWGYEIDIRSGTAHSGPDTGGHDLYVSPPYDGPPAILGMDLNCGSGLHGQYTCEYQVWIWHGSTRITECDIFKTFTFS